MLNDSPRVNPDTRSQVMAAIERLGYRPNRAARALGSGRASTVTVVAANTTLYGYAATLQGIEEAARSAGIDRSMVYLDERQAAADATRHLLGLGHRTVHHVAIPSETGNSARQWGWRRALEEAGTPVPDVLRVEWDVRSAYLAG